MHRNIVKICKKHGPLVEDQTKIEKNGKSGVTVRCCLCKLDKDRKWKKNNWDQHKSSASKARNESRRLYREGLTDIEPKANVWARQDRQNDPEKYREWVQKGREKLGIIRSIKEVTRLRGINLETYYSMVGEQNNRCAICKKNETRLNRMGNIARLSIDHCHKTGKVRDLLCGTCNMMIGNCKESIEILEKAIEYLKQHECST